VESRSAPRDRAAWAIRNHLLSDREAQLRHCQSCSRRIFSGSSSVAGSTTETEEQRIEPLTGDDSKVVGRLCQTPIPRGLKETAYKLHFDPQPPGDLTVFHRDYIRLLRLIRFFARARSNEGARPAQRETEQNNRDLRQQVHRLDLWTVFQLEACPKRRR